MSAGGYRPGSGRKSAEPGDKRVQMVITIDPETKTKLKDVAKSKGVTVGRLLDQIINTMY